LRGLAQESNLKIFGLDDQILDFGTQLALDGIAPKPFDHAILASVLVSASRLWATGERGISFCETDGDLQSWDKNGNIKARLKAAYDRSHVWVYGDFLMADPPRPPDFD
jgi:hypothetical protein